MYNIQERVRLLKALKTILLKNEKAILEALKADLGKSKTESYMTEFSLVMSELKFALKNINNWSKKVKVKTQLNLWPSDSYIIKEPYGTVLIISPWNYPFQLSLSPMISAMAAGNKVVLKLSEYSENTSNLLKQIIPNYLAEIHLGDRIVTENLLKRKFDFILYTGSSDGGKLVMESAAKNLTPVCLELGGKSPVIVTDDADLDLAAKRIIWGKLLNAGQTCVAPDYVFVHAKILEEFVEYLNNWIIKFYGENPMNHRDYCKIISKKHFDRLISYLDGKLQPSSYNEETLKINPIILKNPDLDSKLMTEEIFGPILPIIEYESLDGAISFIKSRPRPLSLYLFSQSEIIQDKVISSISFGGGCINDTVLHVASKYLPFGGVGNSGMGSYRGQFGFDLFSHKKSILNKSIAFDMRFRYPPFLRLRWIKKFL